MLRVIPLIYFIFPFILHYISSECKTPDTVGNLLVLEIIEG